MNSTLGKNGLRSEAYGSTLSLEMLRNERHRAIALASVLGLIIVAITIYFLAAPSFGAMMPGMSVWSPLKAYGPFLAFEIALILVINNRITKSQDLPLAFHYLTAAVETSLPSVILMAHIAKMGTAAGLGFFAPLLYSIFIILSTLRLDFWLASFTGAIAAIEMLVITWFNLPTHPATEVGTILGTSSMPMGRAIQDVQFTLSYQLSRSAALLASGIVAGWIAMRLRHQFDATMQAIATKNSVTNLFGQHVSPSVVERLLATGGEKVSELRRVAVMFVDVRDFAAAAQRRTPKEIVARLDAAFTVMIEVIDKHGGIINKFLGDGFLAIFGAPLSDERATTRATAAGRELLAAVESSNAHHPRWPIRIGIGLHVGEAVTGVVGSPLRKEYTVVGEAVNLASRIESLNKEFGSQFLLSDAARAEVGDDAADARNLGSIQVRGYDLPVVVWQLA